MAVITYCQERSEPPGHAGKAALACLHWHVQVDIPGSRGVSRELAELQLPGEVVESEGKAVMVALMTALPFGVAAGWMLLVAKSSQRTGGFPLLPGKQCVLARLRDRGEGLYTCLPVSTQPSVSCLKI